MRKIIEVLRTDYQCNDFVIDIPDTELTGLSENQIEELFIEHAYEKAANHTYSGGNAEYEIGDITDENKE